MNVVSFLWLELNRLCNLECIHCYNNSGPNLRNPLALSTDRYEDLLSECFALGTRSVQFIGGEPTLDVNLPKLISKASSIGYEFIEVFTNATRIKPELLDCFQQHKVKVASSLYSADPKVHDSITNRQGSHASTTTNLKLLVEAGLEVRVGIIAMEQNYHTVGQTEAFLATLGVSYRTDEVRGFGRAADAEASSDSLSKLCGHCWDGKLCIAYDGRVYPCIMAEDYEVGNVCDSTLHELLHSKRLAEVREQIYRETYSGNSNDENCDPNCNPACQPNCNPACNPSCNPNCWPSASLPCAPAGTSCPPAVGVPCFPK